MDNEIVVFLVENAVAVLLLAIAAAILIYVSGNLMSLLVSFILGVLRILVSELKHPETPVERIDAGLVYGLAAITLVVAFLELGPSALRQVTGTDAAGDAPRYFPTVLVSLVLIGFLSPTMIMLDRRQRALLERAARALGDDTGTGG